MGYYKKVIRGVGWMGALQGFVRGVGYVRIAILARLLTPAQFGSFGVATLALTFLEIITQSGINVFFVQGEGSIKSYINTAWIISIVRGSIIAGVLFFTADMISSYFGILEAARLLKIISIAPLVKGFLNPSIIRFEKELKFGKQFIFRSSVYLFEAIVAVWVAFVTKNPVSLAYGLLAGAVLELILSFIIFSPRPKFIFSTKKAGHILKRGKWVTGAGFFRYAFEQGDDIAVGKLLSGNSLGLYQVAYKISSLPLTEVTEVVKRVTFPVYSKIAGDTARLKRAFKKSFLSISAIVIPFGALLFFFPEQIIRIILGSAWVEAAEVLKILAIFGMLRAITFSVQPIFLAVKKQEYYTYISAISALAMFAVLVPFIKLYGIVGAAYAAILGLVVSIPFTLYYVGKVFKK